MKNTVIFISLVLSFALLFGTLIIPTHADGPLKGSEEIPYTEHNTAVAASSYDSTLTVYTEDEAAAAGVPAGYSDYVIKVAPKSNGAYGGLCIDFSAQNIKIDAVESVTMRIYLPAGNTEMRMRNEVNTSAWIMRQVPSYFDTWVDITLAADGTGFYEGSSMNSLKNADGNLGTFCLIGRFSGSHAYYYIDSVTVKYKQGASGDTTPPVITYNGSTSLNANAGETFMLVGASAYDEFDNTTVPLTYEWEAGAVNAKGELNAGTFTCTVKATDRSGNTASITVTVTAKADASRIVLESIPHIAGGFKHGDGNTYGGTLTEYTAANLPAGAPTDFGGTLTELRSTSNRFGMYFDPTSLAIPTDLIESITFRIYLKEGGNNTFRMAFPGASDWLVLYAPSGAGWCEYTIYADGRGFSNDQKPTIASLANSDGTLGPWGVAIKYPTAATEDVCYIDNVTVTLKKDDGLAPVINYAGGTELLTSAGKPFVLDATAYDEGEGRVIPLVFEWSEGAIDSDGLLVKGEHTVRVSATDHYGNVSEIILTVKVGDVDREAPSINVTATEVYVTAGTLYRFSLVATDNYDNVTVAEEWSAGAVDMYGVLQMGEHTLTLTATDLTGNVTVHTVIFHVVDSITDEFIIDCGAV